MNFDFSALNFETIDSNINAYPDMFINQNSVTFTKKVLEDLGYPAYVLCMLDTKIIPFSISFSLYKITHMTETTRQLASANHIILYIAFFCQAAMEFFSKRD